MAGRSIVSVAVQIAIVAGLVSLAGAADVYVRSGASGDGSKESPYGHLWMAVERARRGDVIHVAAGTYNGKGGCGNFTIRVPNLSIVGGYNEDFSSRDPFRNHTILERAADYKGDSTGLGEGIIEGAANADHGGLVIDGLVLNSTSRNSYHADGNINPKDSWNGALFKANSANIAIRNCILINPFGKGVSCSWRGEGNEVVNNFIVNTFYTAVSTRAAQPDSVVRLANNTIAFVWFQPATGGGMCLFVGRQGTTIAENNIFAFAQTEGDAAGFAVSNTFGNEDTELADNIFFQCQGGYYKYMDADRKSLLVWKPEELEMLNQDGDSFMLARAEGNAEADPKLVPDKDYYEKFSNFVASSPGKLNMDFLNEWRRSVGLPLQAEPGSPRKNWGMQYPLDQVVPNLASKIPGRGAQVDIEFATYASEAVEAAELDYQEVDFEAFKKGAAETKNHANSPVAFKAGIGEAKNTFLLEGITAADYLCVELIKPGDSYPTRNYVFGYILKGSDAHAEWTRQHKRKNNINKKGGASFKGRASYIGTENYSYTSAVVIDQIER